MKKEWEKPELIVLVRGKPEEGVLVTCKTRGASIVQPSTVNNDCEKDNQPQSVCLQCHEYVTS